MLDRLNKWAAIPVIRLIRIYQLLLSPDKSIFFSRRLKGTICQHQPHCSAYGREVLKRYGLFPGLIYMIDRITSCTGASHVQKDPSSYRVVFCSSAPIGVPFLEALQQDKRFNLIGVVTNPDKPVGRGLKIQKNIIKSNAEKIFGTSTRIILLHGKDTGPQKKRYPRLIKWCQDNSICIDAPQLPNPETPVLHEWLAEIDKLAPDENTIIIGHSRGGMAALRRLEQTNQPIKKLITIAANHSNQPDSTGGDFFTQEDYDYSKIAQNLQEAVIIHSEDDQRVPFSHGKAIAAGLKATETPTHTWFPDNKQHFGFNTKTQSKTSDIPELINYIMASKQIQTPPSLRLSSKKYGNEAHQFTQWLHKQEIDLLVVIAYGKIIPQHILDIPTVAPINVHGSLLPEYRGASPIQSVLLDGKKETGITIMRMEAGLDTGPMIDKKKRPLAFTTTALDIIEDMKKKGPSFLNNTMREYAKGHKTETQQDDSKASHSGKLEKERGLIDATTHSLEYIRTTYKGCYLWPKTYMILDQQRGAQSGKQVVLVDIALDPQIYKKTHQLPLLTRVEGKPQLHAAITSLTVKPSGSKTMSREAFLAGHLPH